MVLANRTGSSLYIVTTFKNLCLGRFFAYALVSLSMIPDVIPIFSALDIYAKEKARLKIKGKILDDFDLLIGSTAIFNNLILVTKNVSDFERIEGISIEDWTAN